MKYTILLFIALFATGVEAQINVKVSGTVFNSDQDSVHLTRFFGDHYEYYAGAKLNKNGEFSIATELPFADYYVLKFGSQHVNLVLRNNSDIKVYGDGKNLNLFANIVGSEESKSMNEIIRKSYEWQMKSDSATKLIQSNPELKDQVNRDMSAAYKAFAGEQRTFVAQNHNSAALYPVLQYIDPKNDLASYESIVNQLQVGFGESPSVKGLIEQLNNYKAEAYKNDPLAPGKPAPDFEEAMADGTTMKLSNLKGQVVLLDFWASWCGPCRRENPNVVQLYNKYKDEGFTVMSVSLDRSKDAWLAAIEKDGLTWPNHVSDLKQWSSRVAALYGVHSIPFTVLIDKEGNIIKTNVRGDDLKRELAKQFDH